MRHAATATVAGSALDAKVLAHVDARQVFSIKTSHFVRRGSWVRRWRRAHWHYVSIGSPHGGVKVMGWCCHVVLSSRKQGKTMQKSVVAVVEAVCDLLMMPSRGRERVIGFGEWCRRRWMNECWALRLGASQCFTTVESILCSIEQNPNARAGQRG